MGWTNDRIQAEARRAAGWTTTALGFTIPIWVVADSILLSLLVLFWAVSGGWRERLHRISTNPVALAAILLFGWLLLGTFWGQGDLEDRVLSIKKYANLLLIPLLVSLAVDVHDRNRALLALAASLVVTLLLSLLLGLGLFPSWLIDCDLSNPCVFKRRITHNVLMAFGALLLAVLAWKSRDGRVRWGLNLASLLAASNVLLMVQGRTGYVVLAGLIILALHGLFGWRGVGGALALLALVLSGAYQVSTSFKDRVNLTASNVVRWGPETVDIATQERLEFYQYTVKIIEDHPIIGVGTGGFAQAYEVYAKQAGVPVPAHPHNQYLLIMAQVGIVGIGLLLWLFVQQWRSTLHIADWTYALLAKGLVVTMVIGCLFNSFLIDHTEKLFYCWLSGLMYSGNDSRPGSMA